jgi:hypothetical protein
MTVKLPKVPDDFLGLIERMIGSAYAEYVSLQEQNEQAEREAKRAEELSADPVEVCRLKDEVTRLHELRRDAWLHKVSLPAGYVYTLFEMAKRAKKAKSRPSLTAVEKSNERQILSQARRDRDKYKAEGMSAEEATHKAAKDAEKKLVNTWGRDLGIKTIKDRMRRKR